MITGSHCSVSAECMCGTSYLMSAVDLIWLRIWKQGLARSPHDTSFQLRLESNLARSINVAFPIVARQQLMKSEGTPSGKRKPEFRCAQLRTPVCSVLLSREKPAGARSGRRLLRLPEPWRTQDRPGVGRR